MRAVIVLALLIAPLPAGAQVALFLPDESDGMDTLETAIEASTGWSLVGRAELRERVEARASELGEDVAAEEVSTALQRAHRGYVELRLGESARAYQAALDAMMQARIVPSAEDVARVLFERSLVHLAAHRSREAERDLSAAVRIHPELAPDRSVYGEPILALLSSARRSRGRSHRLAVSGAPEGAVVRVNGAIVEQTTEVRGEGPHLVTAERWGHASRAWLVTARGRTIRVDASLERASLPLLAAQVLARWERIPNEPETLVVAARAASIDRIVRARAGSGGMDVSVTSLAGEVLARAVGDRVTWEPQPWFVLAERLAGREVSAPDGRVGAPVSLAVVSPETVRPDGEVALRVTLEDPDRRTIVLSASCGESETSGRAAPESVLSLVAPSLLGPLRCQVRALDAANEALVERSLEVSVQERPPDDTGWWVLGGAVAAGIATAVIVLGAVLFEPSQRLVIEGLD